jgi:hypothetical protein
MSTTEDPKPAEAAPALKCAYCHKPMDKPGAAGLWALHIPGPDDLYAAPSNEEAVRAAAAYNAAVRPALQAQRDKAGPEGAECYPSIESCLAAVIPWPLSAVEHAQALQEWKPEDWAPRP